MRAPFQRPAKVPADVLARAALARGEKVLAHTMATDERWLLGTRDALVVVPPPVSVEPVETIPWQQVETADWDRDEERLRIAEVGEFGRPRPVHEFSIPEPGRLLPLVRERVTASVLFQRRVPVGGSELGLTVVARRSPRRDGETTTWAFEYDVGVDPADPAVAEAAAAGLRAAREEVGLGEEPI